MHCHLTFVSNKDLNKLMKISHCYIWSSKIKTATQSISKIYIWHQHYAAWICQIASEIRRLTYFYYCSHLYGSFTWACQYM